MKTKLSNTAPAKSELIDAYESWFLSFTWSIWGTLTFRGSPSTARAIKLFDAWINEVKKHDGGKHFRWVRVTEKGAFGDNVHFHILLGGLRDASKYPLMFSWEEIAGTADLYYFDPCRRGVGYMFKSAEPGKDFAVDFHLPHRGERR